MTSPTAPTIQFARLPDVDLTEVLALLNEPRNARHMPLADTFDSTSGQAWVAGKDAQWAEYGYGPWAIVINGAFAGWGSFQHEPNGADFALVLAPTYWGHGAAIVRAALEIGFTELDLDAVLIALPSSRHPDRVVRRFGFTPDGDVDYNGACFHQYRLTRTNWVNAEVAAEARGSCLVQSRCDWTCQ